MTERWGSEQVHERGSLLERQEEPAQPRPAWRPLRSAALPRPLLWLLAAVALVGVAWALLVPAWQAPDEGDHFGYAQSIAERFHLPTTPGRPPRSTEEDLALRSAGTAATGTLVRKVPWNPRLYDEWQRADRDLGPGARSDGGGPSTTTPDPPLYYSYAALVYRAASGGDIFVRLFAMRVASVLLLLGTAVATWLLAGELFGRNRPLQLAAAAVVGLQPMETFISASVTPDALLFPLWALTFWLGVRSLKRGLTPPRAAALFAVAGLAVLAKGASYALLPAVTFVLAAGLWRLRRQSPRRAAALGLASVGAFGVVAGGWILRALILHHPLVSQVGTLHMNLGRFASYLWQFYLPRLPFQTPNPGIRADSLSNLGVYAVWLKTGWAAFGALEVRFPGWVYVILAAFSALVLGGALAALIRRRHRPGIAPLTVFLGLAALGLLAGLHWSEYQLIVETGRGSNQGRYLLPLLPIAGVATAAALTLLAPARRQLALGLLLGGLFGLQLFSLAIVAGRFYA